MCDAIDVGKTLKTNDDESQNFDVEFLVLNTDAVFREKLEG